MSADVRTAAQAIVDHWDTPSWGYGEYTESFIRRLREALAAPLQQGEYLPLPEPDTHCHDEDTGKDVWSHSAGQMRAYVDAHRAARETAPPAPSAQDVEDAARWHALNQTTLMEHSGCGHGTQVDSLTVRLNPGDKVVMLKGRISQAHDKADAARAQQKGGAE